MPYSRQPFFRVVWAYLLQGMQPVYRKLHRQSVAFLWTSPMLQETRVQSQVESYQWLKKLYWMPLCLALSIIRHGSSLKWSNPGKGEAVSPSPWCSSYWKGSLWVTLDKGRLLYYLLISRREHKVKETKITAKWMIIK